MTTRSPSEFDSLRVLIPEEEIGEYISKIPKGETPLWEHWEEFVQTRKDLGKSSATVLSTRSGLRMIIRHTGVLTIEQANNSRETGRAFLKMQKERKQSASSRNTYIKNLQTYFIWLERDGYIKQNNIPRIEKSTEKRKEQLVLKHEEVQQVIYHLHTREYVYDIGRSRDVLFVDLLRLTGARPSELLGLTIESIYKEGGKWVVCIDGKKQKGRMRYYHLPPFAVDSYLTYIRQRAHVMSHDWLFISRTEARWSKAGVNCFFRKISKEIGMRVNPYGFRRYVASQLSERGADMRDIMHHLGHTRMTTTELYIERSCSLTERSSAMMASLAGASQSISTAVLGYMPGRLSLS